MSQLSGKLNQRYQLSGKVNLGRNIENEYMTKEEYAGTEYGTVKVAEKLSPGAFINITGPYFESIVQEDPFTGAIDYSIRLIPTAAFYELEDKINTVSINSHTHSNKAILDQITSIFTPQERDKLLEIPAIKSIGSKLVLEPNGNLYAIDTTYGLATQSSNGLMSLIDKQRLDSMENSAQENLIERITVNGVAVEIVNKVANIVI